MVNFFTNKVFSVEYQSKNYKLNSSDVRKICCAALVGALFLVIGAPIAFFAASYYFRQKKIKQLVSSNTPPQQQKMNDLKNKVFKNNNIFPISLQVSNQKAHFLEVMQTTMGQHLHANQKQTLSNLFDQAIHTPQPRQSFERLINEKVNQPDGWGADKKTHIKNNLLAVFPRYIGDNVGVVPTAKTSAITAQIEAIAKTNVVCFYKKGPTGFLGNFAHCPQGIQIFGNKFNCSEAAFQWRKYDLIAQQNPQLGLQNDTKMQEFFQCNGERAFELNRELEATHPGAFAQNWRNGVRDQVMWDVLNAKFLQNPELNELLKKTNKAYLLEHNERVNRDKYWSDNKDGTGANMLGKMLMAIRDEKPCPIPNNLSDPEILKHAAYANTSLNYQIF